MHNRINAMSGNPLLQVNNWQGLGPGKHSQVSVRHDDWIRELCVEILKLRSEMDAEHIEVIVVKEMLEALCSSKACGVDEVHPHVLKSCAGEFAKPLSLIFKRSLKEGYVPRQWRDANITPIFKKGSRVLAENYRPVSLTSIVCKVMERLVRDMLMKYLDDNKLFTKEQHGFISKKSCATNLIETLDIVTKSLSNGLTVNMVYIDFLKAFDMVPHKRLLHKIKGYGVKNDLLNWFESFLSGRRQRVVLGETISEWKEVISRLGVGSSAFSTIHQ